MENWRAIPGTNDKIEISDYGRVRSWLRGSPKILATTPDRKGYLRLRVTINREKKTFKVHREVAKAFIPNPAGFPQVNHIDGDKSNNNVLNLEWVSAADNASHAVRTGLWDKNISVARAHNVSIQMPVRSVDASTGEERLFESVSEAERFFNSRHVSDVLNGKRKKAAGQYFYRR